MNLLAITIFKLCCLVKSYSRSVTWAKVLMGSIIIPSAGMKWVVWLLLINIQRKRVGVNHLLCLLVTKASSKFILICGCIWPLFALTHQAESYCPNVLDFNSIPSIKIEHIAKNLITKSKQRNYFSECNITFLVYIYLYLLLYCGFFTKILVLLSSVK